MSGTGTAPPLTTGARGGLHRDTRDPQEPDRLTGTSCVRRRRNGRRAPPGPRPRRPWRPRVYQPGDGSADGTPPLPGGGGGGRRGWSGGGGRRKRREVFTRGQALGRTSGTGGGNGGAAGPAGVRRAPGPRAGGCGAGRAGRHRGRSVVGARAHRCGQGARPPAGGVRTGRRPAALRTRRAAVGGARLARPVDACRRHGQNSTGTGHRPGTPAGTPGRSCETPLPDHEPALGRREGRAFRLANGPGRSAPTSSCWIPPGRRSWPSWRGGPSATAPTCSGSRAATARRPWSRGGGRARGAVRGHLAGTRNHFALDLGLDRADPVSVPGGAHRRRRAARRPGRAGGRTFVNNASFGAYADRRAEPRLPRRQGRAPPWSCCPTCSPTTAAHACGARRRRRASTAPGRPGEQQPLPGGTSAGLGPPLTAGLRRPGRARRQGRHAGQAASMLRATRARTDLDRRPTRWSSTPTRRRSRSASTARPSRPRPGPLQHRAGRPARPLPRHRPGVPRSKPPMNGAGYADWP